MNPRATTLLCLACLTPAACSSVDTHSLAGAFAAGHAAHAFQLSSNRWPETKAELEEGAAAAGVKLRPGEIVLAPQPDGRLLVRFEDSGCAGNPLFGLTTNDSVKIYLAPDSPDVSISLK
jgi:hypothetical protein